MKSRLFIGYPSVPKVSGLSSAIKRIAQFGVHGDHTLARSN